MNDNDILILGSGMAGLGAAHRLREQGRAAVLLDKNSHAGGHTSTHIRDGYVFDEGPHVSFTKDERVKQMFAEAIGNDFLSIDAYIDNYWQGQYVRHPVITNMHGMPKDVVVKCIDDYVEAKKNPPAKIENYEDWLVASYGRTYAELFPMQYASKYHTTHASNLSTEWVGPRLYQAKLSEILHGALSGESPNIHYVQDYRYPRHGGFAAFLGGLQRRSDIQLGHKVTGIDPRARTLTCANGKSIGYSGLISSIPLPDLVPMIKGAPKDVIEASQTLACTTVVLVNLGVDRRDLSRASWTYYYDDEFPFSRVSYPCTFSPDVAPAGCGSIQAEVYFSKKYKPLTGNPDACIEPTIEGLRKCGVLRDSDRIVYREAMVIEYANIIFDLDRAPALAKVHGFLDDVGVGYCGRYGDWGYLWSDEAFFSGENAAQRLVDGGSR